MSSIKHIVAITIGQYPNNIASTTRHLAILRGLSECGMEVTCISVYAENYDGGVSLHYHNVKIEHMAYIKERRIKLQKKILLYSTGLVKTILRIIQLRIKHKLEFVMFYSTNLSILIPMILVCKITGIKTIHERTEYPDIEPRANFFRTLNRIIYKLIAIPAMDGLIVISSNLNKYFQFIFRKKILILSVAIETDRFSFANGSPYRFPYFAYCGSVDFYKDGVNVLIKSFALISPDYPDYHLVIIGDIDKSPNKKEIFEMIKMYKLSEKVIFSGYLPSEILPNYLFNATALLLSREINTQTSYGMPSKLGEYLCTGRPVIVTSVSDIHHYLKDGQNSFIATPGSEIEFSKKLRFVIENPEISQRVGINGKMVCDNFFDHKIQAAKLFSYITEL